MERENIVILPFFLSNSITMFVCAFTEFGYLLNSVSLDLTKHGILAKNFPVILSFKFLFWSLKKSTFLLRYHEREQEQLLASADRT